MIKVGQRILILCEDEKSSLLYFKAFKVDEKLKRNLAGIDIDVFHPKNHSPLGLVDEAKKRKKEAKKDKNKYDQVWVVFDKDGHPDIDKAVNKAQDNGIKVALANICFEIWILLHFEKVNRPFKKCDEVIKYIKEKGYLDYTKTESHFEILKDKLDNAIDNNEWLLNRLNNDIERGVKLHDLPIYSNLHLIVKQLINKSSPRHKRKKGFKTL